MKFTIIVLATLFVLTQAALIPSDVVRPAVEPDAKPVQEPVEQPDAAPAADEHDPLSEPAPTQEAEQPSGSEPGVIQGRCCCWFCWWR